MVSEPAAHIGLWWQVLAVESCAVDAEEVGEVHAVGAGVAGFTDCGPQSFLDDAAALDQAPDAEVGVVVVRHQFHHMQTTGGPCQSSAVSENHTSSGGFSPKTWHICQMASRCFRAHRFTTAGWKPWATS